MTEQAATEADKSTVITAYKGFDSDMRCRGFQFEVGKTYTHEGPVELCRSGFHACEEPFDCFKYYSIVNGKFAEVELAGVSDERDGDTKRVGSTITIRSMLGIAGIVEAQIEWCRWRANADYSGYRSRSASSGVNSVSASSGDRSRSVSSGDGSVSASSGYGSVSASSGDRSRSASSGVASVSASSGVNSVSASSGYGSVSVSSGDRSRSASSGDGSRSACGTNGFASVAGINGAVKGGAGSALSLGYVDAGGELDIAVAKVGKNGIKPDTWYRVNEVGKFVEVTP